MGAVYYLSRSSDPIWKLTGPGGWVADLPGRLKNAVGATGGRKLIAGFRPEHLELKDAEGETVTVPGHAEVVEYLGNEELLHVTTNSRDLVAIVDSSQRVVPGQAVKLHVPLDKVYLFDPETGLALDSRQQTAAA